MNREFFTGKSVLVMGLGQFGGGVDAARFAAGAGAKVIVTDLAERQQLSNSIRELEGLRDIEFHLAGHNEADFENTDIVIVNPAVPLGNKFLDIARKYNKFITSQISIFFELSPATIIGITGSVGKSTTATLTAHLLRAGVGQKGAIYRKVWLSGNIGNEPLLTVIDQIDPADLVVLELSSFQIEQLAQIEKAPKVALLTNLIPNHLDRYGTFSDYYAAKENIFKFQQPDENRPAVSIFNAEDKIGSEWFERYSKDKGRVCIRFSADDVSEEIRAGFALAGRANLSNLAAAVAIAGRFGLDDETIKRAVPKFSALSHRLEFIAEINGVKWYNDSKATTPQSTIVALESFEQPRIIIAGGYDKKVSFDELGEKIAQNAKAAILLGQTAPKIASSIRNLSDEALAKADTRCEIRSTKVEIVDSLNEAVSSAKRLAATGDVVLLSPACASYDMFDNFQQRGKQFCRLVQQLAG